MKINKGIKLMGGLMLVVCLLVVGIRFFKSKQEQYVEEQLNLGYRFLEEMNYEEAIVAFTNVIQIEPNNTSAYTGRGNAYILSAETQENIAIALADYEAAIAINENVPDAWLGIVDVYIRCGDFETALIYAQEGYAKSGDKRLEDKANQIKEGNISDSQGKTRRMSAYGENHILLYYLDFTYQSDGLVDTVTSFNKNGFETGRVQCEYDEDGKTLVSYGYGSNDGNLSIIRYQYDSKGNKQEEIWYKLNGEFHMHHTYEYDPSGNNVRTNSLDSNGQLDAYELFTYNSEGKSVHRGRYSQNGELQWYQTYEYSEYGKRNRMNRFDAEGTLNEYTLSYYDEKGKLVRTEDYKGDGTLFRSRDYN